MAYLRYRDYAGKGHRLKRAGRSKAEASHRVHKAVRDALGAHDEGELNRKSTLDEAARAWLVMFEGLVRRGAVAVDPRRVPARYRPGRRARRGLAAAR